jgi:hypothetical protein
MATAIERTTRLIAQDAEQRAATVSGSAGTGPGEIHRTPIVVPLETLQGETSGTSFDIFLIPLLPGGLALRLIAAEIEVVNALAAPGLTDAHVELGNPGSPGRIISPSDIFGLTGFFATPGSNPFQSSGGPIALTVTLLGAAMAALTAGDLQVNLYFASTT